MEERTIWKAVEYLVERYNAEELAEKYLEEREMKRACLESEVKLYNENMQLRRLLVANGVERGGVNERD